MTVLESQVGVELDGFSLDAALDAAERTTVAIVGPNGSGKTTLLRALAGLQPLHSGRITLDGDVWDDGATTWVAPERRPVGMVFQDAVLFPHLRVVDNVAFGLRSRGASRADARRRAQDWLDRLGLGERADAWPDELSGGQAQRVALARALAPGPRVLLLDEPLAALDASTRNEVRRDLRDHLGSFDGVRVVVTHDPIDAAVLADRVVVLDEGRVVQEGTPGDITARPRSGWVAELAGTNLFAGTAEASGIALDGGGTLVAPARTPRGRVFAVVHPRAVAVHSARPTGSARNVWQGRVASIEPVGDRARVRIDATPAIVAEVTPSAVDEMGLGPGVPVWVAVKATEVDVYEA